MSEPQNRLLVVDDEFPNREALARRLARHGFSVDTAEGAGPALDKMLRDRYDLVVLDQMMPGMSGLDLLRLLRATYSPTELPVIMVTANDQNEMIAQALDEGANDYLVKPVDMREITARIQAQLLRSKGHRLKGETAANGAAEPCASQDGTWDWDPITRTAYFSERWKELLGHSPEDIGETLKEWLDRIHPEDLVRVRQQLHAHMEGTLPEFRCEHRLRHKNGQYRWMLSKGVALRSAEGALLRLAGSMADINDVKAADPLTGLANRPQLLERLESANAVARPGARQSVALLLVGIDGLRLINHTAGHEAGDRVLIEAAARLREVVAASSFCHGATIARVGGDEFGILVRCPGATCDVARLAEALLERLAQPMPVREQSIQVTASVGVVIAGAHTTPAQLLRDADLAMCQAQQLGHHRWHLYEPSLRNRAEAAVVLSRDLRHAVERNELVAVYQPKVVLAGGATIGFEALLRWRHPELGMVGPNDFIPIAEQSGLIVPAGEWILRTACQQLREWLERFPTDPPLAMSVNLSPRQLNDSNLLSAVRRALDDFRIPPGCLRLELTESALVAERESARTVLSAIQRMGVGFELDDFGTGYSSLGYLNLLRFDALKIDRSFVGRLESNAECRVIIRTIIAMARELGMQVVAEGIETETQAAVLLEMGCEFGQGYLFSMPVEAQTAGKLLERSRTPEPLVV